MKIIRTVLILSLVLQTAAIGQEMERRKTIAVLGSSLAAGWVTSHKSQYDMQNGFAARLGRLLADRGYELINVSTPGFTTGLTLQTMDESLAPVHPDYVIVALSLSNEGIQTADRDTVLSRFEKNLKQILQKIRQSGAVPVVGTCYACNEYGNEDYRYIQKMNFILHSWNVPSIHLLGGLNDGNGHFPEGLTWDPSHPADLGHEELFYTIVPSLFDAIGTKPVPGRIDTDGSMVLKRTDSPLVYVPQDIMHSFSMSFRVRMKGHGRIAGIHTGSNSLQIDIGRDGYLRFEDRIRMGADGPRINDGAWHEIVAVHRHIPGETILFVDGKEIGGMQGQITPLSFSIGPDPESPKTFPSGAEFQDWILHRCALTPEEVALQAGGKWIQASLEVFAPLRDPDPSIRPANLALSLGVIDRKIDPDKLALLNEKIERARAERENQPVFKEKEPVPVDPEVLALYPGKYEIAPGDFFEVSLEDGRLYFSDRGQKTELLAESQVRFFIRYPMPVSVTFEMEGDAVKGLIFQVGGREMKARKVEQ